jgi:hypothetical protein
LVAPGRLPSPDLTLETRVHMPPLFREDDELEQEQINFDRSADADEYDRENEEGWPYDDQDDADDYGRDHEGAWSFEDQEEE